MGSTGNGRPTRASTASVTATTNQRRSNTRSARLRRAPLLRSDATARPRADDCSCGFRERQRGVTCRPLGLKRLQHSRVAFQQRGKKSARLDVPKAGDRRSLAGSAHWPPGGRAARPGWRLRFATVAVDQFGGGSPRQPDIRPLFETGCRPRAVGGSRPRRRARRIDFDARSRLSRPEERARRPRDHGP